jgi:hypothetical protein
MVALHACQNAVDLTKPVKVADQLRHLGMARIRLSENSSGCEVV